MTVSSGIADADGASFRLADRPRRLAGVRLVQEIDLPGPLTFDRVGGEWRLRVEQPAVDRLEYLLEVTDQNDRTATVPDPGNPRRAPGAFGEKSVVEFAGYRPPSWLEDAPAEGSFADHSFAGPDGGDEPAFEVRVWSPDGLDVATPAPLLAVHDGPEFAALGSFVHYAAAAVAAGMLPPLRVALLDPGDRNVWYSANDAYAQRLCTEVLPALPPATARIGVGASLGALAMLHAHRRQPGTFAALFLQSGSFFTPALDPQESGFSGFAAVSAFVASVHDSGGDSPADAAPVPTVLTCGTVEENLANNEAMAVTLAELGHPVSLVPRRDAHNFVAWRDALDPCLTDLVRAVTHAS